jgi:hypothetical protein
MLFVCVCVCVCVCVFIKIKLKANTKSTMNHITNRRLRIIQLYINLLKGLVTAVLFPGSEITES